MTTQINLRLNDNFLEQVKEYAQSRGFLNVQEFFREAAREKLFDNAEIREDYIKRLESKDANSFLSAKETKDFEKELNKRAMTE